MGYEKGVWRIRTNKELTDLHKTSDVLGDIKSRRLA
jgi:hypothetical protein